MLEGGKIAKVDTDRNLGRIEVFTTVPAKYSQPAVSIQTLAEVLDTELLRLQHSCSISEFLATVSATGLVQFPWIAPA